MRQRNYPVFFILTAMMLQFFLPIMTIDVDASDSARGGTNDDFHIKSITIGNLGYSPEMWVQSDGSVVEYVMKGDLVPIGVTVMRNGGALSGASADVLLEAVHPIGFVAWSSNWSTGDVYGGGEDSHEAVWTADTAHSILNGSELLGGYILRATVNYFADTKNENDVLNQTIPVAFSSDIMDGSLLSGQRHTMVPFRYEQGGAGDAVAVGSWQDDDTSAYVGSAHWRHSNPGSNYGGNAWDRLVWGYAPASNDCGSAIHEGGAGAIYGMFYCRLLIPSLDLVSVQMHATAWGVIGNGDDVALELWRSGGVSLRHNLSTALPMVASGQGQWTNLSWDPTDLLGGHSWFAGMLFTSDNSIAEEGYHVDDWRVFAVEKIDQFTLDVTCDNPVAGYTAVPNEVISLYCEVTNNGYKPAIIRVKSNISNETWMEPTNPKIRIDSSHPTQHGVEVQLPATAAGATTEMWINLSIPAGADIQQQTWNVTWSDGSSQGLGVLASLQATVGVTEQYSVVLSSSTPLLAGNLGPGETEIIPMRLQNTGNRLATFNMFASFSVEGWTSAFTDIDGDFFLPVTLDRGQIFDFNISITSAADAAPDNYSFSVRALCTTCGGVAVSGNDVLIRTLEVLPFREVELIAESLEISAPANGILQRIALEINNLGNDDEVYDLVLTQSNAHLLADLSADSTGTLDAWDGFTEIHLDLPMPLYLDSGLYSATIRIVNQADPSVFDSVTISVTVLDTAAVGVSADDPEQSYIPGGDSDTIRFEIRNEGNAPDSFDLSTEGGTGMSAEIEGLSTLRTPTIAPGASYNITVRFSFDESAEGQVGLEVSATSVLDSDISTTGTILFSVGSQDWLRLIAVDDLVIDEAGTYEVVLTLRNQFTGEQTVSIDVRQESSSSMWYRASSSSEAAPLRILEQKERFITVEIVISETSLLNLQEDEMLTTFEVWAISNTVEDATNATIRVTLMKINTKDSDSDTDSVNSGSKVADYAVWVIGPIIVLALLGMLFKVITATDEEDETPWANEEYESSLSAQYGAVPAAPDVQPAPDMSQFAPPSVETAPVVQAAPIVEAAPVMEVSDSGVPPVPAAGLPEGWSMEQWTHYGAEWLKKNA
ncbi:MAG TPA: hypothetical protein EYQ85_01225 [Candidatus Poseidoniales archaeon]|nr:hypothetical protein [Candidatus Poseidoniales archaeon]